MPFKMCKDFFSNPMEVSMTKMIEVNEEKCTGCRMCEIVCSQKHHGRFSPAMARIQNFIFEDQPFYFSLCCQQCEDAPCAVVCPSSALVRDPETGVINLRDSACMGCKMCILACPFGTMTFLSETGRVQKCDYCGGEPECVIFCPTGALEFKDADLAGMGKRTQFVKKMQKSQSVSS
jgi:carbon-monoxide dehydrogenase iron sulfur subunit